MGTSARFNLVTSYSALRIAHFLRRGCFPDRHAGGELRWTDGNSIGFEVNGDFLVFKYSCGGESVLSQVRTETTPTNFNGRRRWFTCPNCGRRRAVLYVSRSGVICRACLRLVYPTTRERTFGRAVDKRDKLYRRLGARVRDGIERIEKPKGMHWKTFERKKRKLQAAQDAVVRTMGACLEVMKRRLG